jgi:hypothetical protein
MNPINYGEGVRPTASTTDSFDIVRPTIELPLDELLTESSDCSEAWSVPAFSSTSSNASQSYVRQLDLVTQPDIGMESEAFEHPFLKHTLPDAPRSRNSPSLPQSSATLLICLPDLVHPGLLCHNATF